MGYYNMRLQAFHKDLFYESVWWKAGNGPPVLVDGDDKKLPKKACLRLVVPNIIRIALAKLPVVEVVEVVEEGSTTAPTAELPLEPKDLELLDPNEPAVSQNRAQDLLLSGKEVWAATLALADVVALWSQNRGLPRILVQEQEEIYVSAQFLQAHCKKLSLEGSPRSQRERSRSPRRCKQAAEEEQAEAAQPAEDVEMPDAKPEEAEPAAVAEPESALPDADAKPAEEGLVGEIRGEWLDLYLDDKAIYDDARERVESGFVFGWVLDCEMILDSE
ncbi:arcC, partial [Symbiodinium sp. KB8]